MGVENRPHDPQEHAHQADTDEERLLPAESLNSEIDEQARDDDFDDTVDSTREETSLLTFETDGLEDERGVVRDTVLAAPLLQRENHEAFRQKEGSI